MVEQLEPRPLAPVGERGAALVGVRRLEQRVGVAELVVADRSAVSRSRWSGSQWETLVSYELGPPTEEASLLLELANIRFASCVPF